MNKIIPKLRPADAAAPERYKKLLDLSFIAARITERGWSVDRNEIRRLRAAAVEKQARFTNTFLQTSGLSYEHLGKKGTGHTHSVRDFFWNELKAPHVVFDKISKKPQFNSAALVAYAEDFKNTPFSVPAALLLGIRKNAKIQSYLEAYDALSRQDGRIHVGFNVSQAKTGRWSASSRQTINNVSYSCNVQQVPGKAIMFDLGNGLECIADTLRPIFAAEPGCVVISADYNALEARLIALNHQVPALLAILAAGGDIHEFTARKLFGDAAYAAQPKLLRSASKTCLYAFSYQYSDGSADAEYKQAYDTLKKEMPQLTARAVTALASKFFSIYPEILASHQITKSTVDNAGGLALPASGRFLHYPPTNRGYNQALNFLQQGTGAVLLDNALLALAPQLDWQKAYPLAQVHDELVVHCSEKDSQDIAQVVKSCMETPLTIGGKLVSFPAEAKIGPNWGACK